MTKEVHSKTKRTIGWREVARFIVSLMALFFCYRLILASAASGLSRLFSTSAIVQLNVGPADAAVRLAPSDPEAHYTRALTLVNLQRLDEAVVELKQATALRPYHYYEWLDLGVTLDRIGDRTAAISALQESVRLAPSFAQPHWQLGNLFYQQGQYAEAFAELRSAVKSNPALVTGMMDLAWVAADGDVGDFEALTQPQTARAHLHLAVFLAKHGRGADAARQVTEAGEPQEVFDRGLLNETMFTLLEARQFPDAYAAWAASHPRAVEKSSNASIKLLNGDFVEPIIQDDPGFGWQLSAIPNVLASIDPSGPGPGTRSLRIVFGGDSPLAGQAIHQLVLLTPNTHYSLSFAARVEQLVSGGPPVIVALAADAKTTKILGQSEPLSSGTSGWATYKVSFSTDENTSVVIIGLQRIACNQSPCPIFGELWLSRFSLAKT